MVVDQVQIEVVGRRMWDTQEVRSIHEYQNFLEEEDEKMPIYFGIFCCLPKLCKRHIVTYMDSVTKTLNNGLAISAAQTSHLKKASFIVLVRAGAIYEQDDQRGIFHLIEHCVFNGSEQYATREEIENKLRELGVIDMVDTTMEFTKYSFSFHTKNSIEVIEFLFEILLRPIFEQDTVEKEKLFIREEIASDKNHNDKVFYLQSKKVLFGGTPFEHDPAGDEVSLACITTKDLQETHCRYYVPENMMCSYVGAEESSKIFKTLEMVKGFHGGAKAMYPKKVLNRSVKNKEHVLYVSDSFNYISLTLFIPYEKKDDNDLMYLLQDVLHQRMLGQAGYESGVGSTEFDSFAILDVYSNFIEGKKDDTIKYIKEQMFGLVIKKSEFEDAKKRLIEYVEMIRENSSDYAESLVYTLAAGEINKKLEEEKYSISSITFSDFQVFAQKILSEKESVLFTSK